MANHDAVGALPVGSAPNKALLRDVLVKRMPYALADSDNPQALVETDPASGAVIIDINYLGRIFHVDAADTTTPHDGVTCLVTAGGVRYKVADAAGGIAYSVLSRVTVPTGSETIGDAYLVKPAATGTFASHDNEIAVLTARGWEFIDFGIGRLIYVEDEDVYYRRKIDGTWTKGFGASALGASTVAPSAMIGTGGRVFWIFEIQTTNVPPAVVDGTAYIIGSAPTGAWANSAGKIAHGEGGTWVIYTPAAGWFGYDKANAGNYQYSGSAWSPARGQFTVTRRIYAANATWVKPANLFKVLVEVVGNGGNGSVGAAGNTGSTASFGSHCSATGGVGGNNAANQGTGGTGTGGDINLTGETGQGNGASVANGFLPGGRGAGRFGAKGQGGGVFSDGDGQGGGGGGMALKEIDATVLNSSETVTVGSAGQNNGYVYVEEYINA